MGRSVVRIASTARVLSYQEGHPVSAAIATYVNLQQSLPIKHCPLHMTAIGLQVGPETGLVGGCRPLF